jgi:hypothetical protein
MQSPVSWSFTTSTDSSGCPCTLFGSSPPLITATNDATAVSVGVKFTSDVNGWISGVRFYKGSGNGGTHTGSLWSSTGTRLATGTFTNESATGWQTLTFATPVPVTANTTYVASYYAPQGHYAGDSGVFNNQYDNPPLHALASGAANGNGVYAYGGDVFPGDTYGATNYGVDATIQLTPPPDTTPPTAQPAAPQAGATQVPINTKVQALFSESVVSSSISVTLKTAAGASVAGTIAYDDPSKTVTFTPSASLATNTNYTATVSGAKDPSGNQMAPLSWSFTTTTDVTGCPCTIFNTTAPANPAVNDPSAVSLGVKFTSDSSGSISGVRFYKGSGNGGTHTGSLWSSTGTRLATGTFTNETASGWQTLTFATPVPITANTTYIASYYAPQGDYAVTPGLFNSQVDAVPLHALADASSGGNGVFLYGSDGFPTSSYNATSYSVDPIFIH